LVLRDLSLINEQFSPDLLILDEAQRIKNWRTQIATAIKLIPSRYAFVLSGTPLENRLEDLYSLMQVVDSRVLGPLWRYLIDFHITDEKGKVLGYRNLSELRKRLAPVMLRRDRRLVADQLPERIQQQIDLPLTDVQRELHDAAMTAAGSLAQISKKRPLTPGERNRMMAALQQARMACDAAGLVDKETVGAPKLDELDKLLDELCLQGGRKAVVFSQWAMMTEMVEQRLRVLGLGCVRLHGGVPTAKRGDLMDRFRDDDSIQVFISTDAGGVGLNLQNASVLINLDIPWNPAVLEQRIARIHRLGQREKVQVILLVTPEGYEGRVLQLVQNKQNLFDNVIDPDASEDVVGVSPKLLEKLVEDLTVTERVGGAGADSAEESAEIPEAKISDVSPRQGAEVSAIEAEITGCIESLQQTLGSRIERIMGANGGLLVIIDRVDEEAELFSQQLSEASSIQVALIDLVSLNSLRRLGLFSEQQPVYYNAGESQQDAQTPALISFANERLQAAEALIQQEISVPAVDLIVAALLATAAVRGEQSQAPTVEQAGVWVY
ncbi:MAG: DEAD/DEAH box helicase, partial [Gammaproteobacteria bacterium]|nr:DEAD/DEAH box helicase [Gammaproteobacteria bacterium]